MTPNEYQAKAAETCLENSNNYPYLVMGLASEAGEVADKFKKAIRDGIPDTEKYKEGVTKELGDVLWYVANIARLMGVSLEDVMAKNVEKLALRKKRDCLHGSGDDREHAATTEDIAPYMRGTETGRNIDEADDGS